MLNPEKVHCNLGRLNKWKQRIKAHKQRLMKKDWSDGSLSGYDDVQLVQVHMDGKELGLRKALNQDSNRSNPSYNLMNTNNENIFLHSDSQNHASEVTCSVANYMKSIIEDAVKRNISPTPLSVNKISNSWKQRFKRTINLTKNQEPEEDHKTKTFSSNPQWNSTVQDAAWQNFPESKSGNDDIQNNLLCPEKDADRQIFTASASVKEDCENVMVTKNVQFAVDNEKSRPGVLHEEQNSVQICLFGQELNPDWEGFCKRKRTISGGTSKADFKEVKRKNKNKIHTQLSETCSSKKSNCKTNMKSLTSQNKKLDVHVGISSQPKNYSVCKIISKYKKQKDKAIKGKDDGKGKKRSKKDWSNKNSVRDNTQVNANINSRRRPLKRKAKSRLCDDKTCKKLKIAPKGKGKDNQESEIMETFMSLSLPKRPREYGVFKAHYQQVHGTPSINSCLDNLEINSVQVQLPLHQENNFSFVEFPLEDLDHWSDGDRLFKFAENKSFGICSKASRSHPGGIWRSIVQEF